jgi:transcriptional regulator with XRE-family HTH domain
MLATHKTGEWQTDDAAALVKARGMKHMSRADFARALSISEKQLTQLEEGGSSHFYSERIKYQIGQKILGYFGIFTVHEQKLSHTTEAKALTKLQAEIDNGSTSGFELRNGHVLLTLLVLALTAAAMYLPSSLVNDLLPSLDDTRLSAPTQPIATNTTETIQPEPTVLAEAPPVKKSLECDWNGTPTLFKPVAATRPSDRVHLMATTDVEVCLQDGAGQVQIVKIKALDQQTIQGSGAPWLIYTPQMDYLKVFYQGFLIFIPKEETNFVKLVPRL